MDKRQCFLVYAYYIPGFEIGKGFKSPLPNRKDDTPSFRTKEYEDVITWKDFGKNSKFGNGPIGFVAEMERLSSKEEAKEFIFSEILTGFFKNKLSKTNHGVYVEHDADQKKDNVNYVYGPLQKQHIDYYDNHLVSPRLLYFFKMYALVRLDYAGNSFWKANDLYFGFFWMIGERKKAYMPFNKILGHKVQKFMQQGPDDIDGYEFLPMYGEILIFTKARKDILVLRSATYPSVTGSTETGLSLIKRKKFEFEARFKYLIIWPDPDPTGMAFARELMSVFPKARVAESIIAKDPSDIVLKTQTFFYIHLIIDRCLRNML